MTIQQIVDKFNERPSYLSNGANTLAKKWGCTPEQIYKAKERIKKGVKHTIDDTPSAVNVLSEKVSENGDKEVQLVSDKPLSRKEVEELYHIDNISTKISIYWNKQQPNGLFLTSVLIKCLIEDFYSQKELHKKLRDLFPDVSPYSIPKVTPTVSDKALFIYIGDDHCGLVLKNSLYKKEYSGKTYAQRLLAISEEVKALGKVFEDVYVINMGDELDGYNQKTTRYDHTLDSLSNKEQFDIYVTARRVFYDDLFSSGIGKTYRVVNLNNSNHSGLGFSYMATKSVSIYLEARFPEVSVIHVPDFITTATYGIHVINLTHGKDEKYMKSGWPLNLDLKTENWITEYTNRHLKNEGEDLNKRWYVSTMKADLHKYNVNKGKCGRYVNVPSISSGSNWIEHNFGESEPGALIEIVDANSPNITSTPIWF